jgi:hypothetical protein
MRYIFLASVVFAQLYGTTDAMYRRDRRAVRSVSAPVAFPDAGGRSTESVSAPVELNDEYSSIERTSVWLELPNDLDVTRKGTQDRPSCLGVFTDNPRDIAARLPRPKTPFVPAPDEEIGLDGLIGPNGLIGSGLPLIDHGLLFDGRFVGVLMEAKFVMDAEVAGVGVGSTPTFF